LKIFSPWKRPLYSFLCFVFDISCSRITTIFRTLSSYIHDSASSTPRTGCGPKDISNFSNENVDDRRDRTAHCVGGPFRVRAVRTVTGSVQRGHSHTSPETWLAPEINDLRNGYSTSSLRPKSYSRANRRTVSETQNPEASLQTRPHRFQARSRSMHVARPCRGTGRGSYATTRCGRTNLECARWYECVLDELAPFLYR